MSLSEMLKRTKEAAEQLTVAESTMEAWRVRGGGPVFVKLGKAVRYRQSDLNIFIESRLRKNTSELVSDRQRRKLSAASGQNRGRGHVASIT